MKEKAIFDQSQKLNSQSCLIAGNNKWKLLYEGSYENTEDTFVLCVAVGNWPLRRLWRLSSIIPDSATQHPSRRFRGVTNGNVYGGGQYIVVGVVKEVKGNWVLTDNGTWVNFDTVVEFSISK